MLRAAVSVSADVNVELHRHIREKVRCWTSDGADRDVGLAATGPFPNLAFHAWDESHSAGRLLQNALKDDPEIGVVDKLLVTGKKPYSLAKFLSTSGVFRKKFGDAQQAEGVAFLRNFGWAPQRFKSRAKPYARECRRWNAIWTSVAAEAASASDKGRKELAESFLSELGGEYSSVCSSRAFWRTSLRSITLGLLQATRQTPTLLRWWRARKASVVACTSSLRKASSSRCPTPTQA